MKNMIKVLALVVSAPAFAATSFVTVTGKCQIKVIPDQASVIFTAEALEKDQQNSVKKVSTQINDLTEKVKALNLKGLVLDTSAYQVNQQKEWENNKMVDKGYRASLSLTVTSSETAKMGEVLALGSKAGISNVGNLKNFLSIEKEQIEYLKCLDLAAANAQQKAEQLAKKLKAKVGDVLEIYESAPSEQAPTPVFSRMAMKGASDSVPVESGEQLFTTQIQVKFSLK